ncbi:MAG: hypothetical protein NT075_14710 [Chloroflexi bacterium]|nr:hypothetical protein [Chloroflexota bacterium]
MYAIVLGLHNLNRWLVLGLGCWSFYQLFSGWRQQRAWRSTDQKSIQWFVGLFTLQGMLGATLYLLPGGLVATVRQDIDLAVIMKQRVLRFFVLEHPVQMGVALLCGYAALVLAQRIRLEERRLAIGALLLGIALLLIITAIPWPFLSQGRPWLRLP